MVKGIRLKSALLSLAFLLLIIGNIGVQAFYLHLHYYNGRLVSHAHPFNISSDSKPIKTHHHSSYEWVLIDEGNCFNYPSIGFDFAVSAKESSISTNYFLSVNGSHLFFDSNRAPPANGY